MSSFLRNEESIFEFRNCASMTAMQYVPDIDRLLLTACRFQ